MRRSPVALSYQRAGQFAEARGAEWSASLRQLLAISSEDSNGGWVRRIEVDRRRCKKALIEGGRAVSRSGVHKGQSAANAAPRLNLRTAATPPSTRRWS